MLIKESNIDEVPVYRISGKIMGGEDVSELCSKLKTHFSSGNKSLVIDLADVEWTNSCGLGMLVGIHVSAINSGGHLALANIKSIKKLLKMTRLIDVLNTYDSIDAAVRSSLRH